MKERPDLKFRSTLEDIRLYFDFLFKRGYRIASVLFADQNNENWQISLMSSNCLINIYGTQGLINLELGMMQNNEVKLFDLEDMAQFVDNGRKFSYMLAEYPVNEAQQFKKIAGFLEKHYAKILAQVERESLPKLNRLLERPTTQPKRTIAS